MGFGTSSRRIVAALALGAVALGCSEEAPPEPAGPRPVKLLAIGDSGAARTLEYPGVVEALQHAELGFEVSGRIIELPVVEGQEVEAGAVLAKLDPRNFDAELDAQRAQVRAARAEYDRMQALFDRDVASEQELDRARRAFEVTQAKLRIDQKAVEDAVLRAPFAGVVARKLVEDFGNIQAKEPVLILQDDSGLQVVVAIPERDWVWAGSKDVPREERERVLRPRVIVSNYPDRELPATLREVATTADPTTRTFALTLGFEAAGDLRILPGMTAKAVLDLPVRQVLGAITIPSRAVLQNEGETPYVWRVDSDTLSVSRAEVSLGELSGDHVEITSGLSPGDEIAVSGVHQLRDGMTVRRFEP